MAKTSAVQRNLKRIRLSKKYYKKRMELKKIINNKKLPLSDRFAAQLGGELWVTRDDTRRSPRG